MLYECFRRCPWSGPARCISTLPPRDTTSSMPSTEPSSTATWAVSTVCMQGRSMLVMLCIVVCRVFLFSNYASMYVCMHEFVYLIANVSNYSYRLYFCAFTFFVFASTLKCMYVCSGHSGTAAAVWHCRREHHKNRRHEKVINFCRHQVFFLQKVHEFSLFLRIYVCMYVCIYGDA